MNCIVTHAIPGTGECLSPAHANIAGMMDDTAKQMMVFDKRHGEPGKAFVTRGMVPKRAQYDEYGNKYCGKRKTPRDCVAFFMWRPHGDSNPGTHRERVMS
jgi:hypothetical protein